MAEIEALLGGAGAEPASRVRAGRPRAARDRPRAPRRRDRPSFPIVGYDDLTAAQVPARLGDLRPPELRKVRDYERRNANRKTVLAAIEHELG